MSKKLYINRTFQGVCDSIGKFLDSSAPLEYVKDHPNIIPPHITHPKTGHIRFIGDEAYERLTKISAWVRQNHSLDRVISQQDINREILDLFAEYAFGNSFGLKDGASFADELLKRVQSKFQDFTIYVPCAISHNEVSEEVLDFGAVRLLTRPIFLQIIKSSPEDTGQGAAWARMRQEAIDHYQGFNWFVEVKIEGVYNYETATQLGLPIAESMINLLHLNISASHSHQMKTGFDLMPDGKIYGLYIGNNSRISTSLSWRDSRGNVGLPSPLLSIFDGYVGQKLIACFKKMLPLLLDFKTDYPICRRIMESAYWYGDAVRESSLSVKVVKYITALERLLSFDENGGLKERLANRGAALMIASGAMDVEHAKVLKENIKTAYKVRSNIVHGNASPLESSFNLPVFKIEELCRLIIISFCILVCRLDETGKENGLKDWMLGVVKATGSESL